MLKQILLPALIMSTIHAGTALQNKVRELEKRIERLEKQNTNRKQTCPPTCHCGAECACKNCKCGVK